MNNNGYNEEIYIIKNNNNQTRIIVREKEKTLGQWNFNGVLTSPRLYYGDLNNNGLKEIFLFTIFENRILLNCFNPLEDKKYIINKHIDDFYPKHEGNSCSLKYCKLVDEKEDNKVELVFAFRTGYAVSPRRMYSYNFTTDSLTKSWEAAMFYKILSL